MKTLRRFASLGRRLIPAPVVRSIVRWTRRPAPGAVDFGDLRRLRPVSQAWGTDRGLPIDRFYIESFLAAHREHIRGRVLEIGDDRYTREFGDDRVTRSDVLHIDSDHPGITIVADLTNAPQIASESFDCIICTQTLQFIPDSGAAVDTLHRILSPDGVLLVTVPTLSRLDFCDRNRAQDHWRFTSAAARWLVERRFGEGRVGVTAYGNLTTATAFLHGLATEELAAEELAHHDPAYEVLVGVRARKADTGR